MTELEARDVLERAAAELTEGNQQFCLILQRENDYLLLAHYQGESMRDYFTANTFKVKADEDDKLFKIFVNKGQGASKKFYEGVAWRTPEGDLVIDVGNEFRELKRAAVSGSASDYLNQNFRNGDYLKINAPVEGVYDILEHRRRVQFDQILKG